MQFQLTGVQACQLRNLFQYKGRYRRKMKKPDAHCAATFCMPGGATAIMIARTRATEKITLSAKWLNYWDDAGRGKWSGVKRSRFDAEVPYI